MVCKVAEALEPVAVGRLERWIGDMAIAEAILAQETRE